MALEDPVASARRHVPHPQLAPEVTAHQATPPHGFDNVPFSRYSRPALSTIAQDTMKAGRLMVSKLLDHAGEGGGRSERIPTDLIVRETCGG